MNTFDELKSICQQACRSREACKKGYAELLAADTPTLLLRAWVNNWADVWRDRYPDIINERVNPFYELFREEFLSVGLTVNECVGNEHVLITDCKRPIRVYGTARVYVVGSAEVHAYENAQVFNEHASGALVVLHDYASGTIHAGRAEARDRSRLQCRCDAACYNASEVYVEGGTLHDYRHRKLMVLNEDAKIINAKQL